MSDPRQRPAATAGGRERDPGGRRALLLAMGGAMVIVLLLPLPIAAVLGFVLAVAGIVEGVRAQRRASAARSSAPGASSAMVVGALTAVVALISGIGLALFAEQIGDYTDCLSGANTNVARANCEEQFRTDIEQRTGVEL